MLIASRNSSHLGNWNWLFVCLCRLRAYQQQHFDSLMKLPAYGYKRQKVIIFSIEKSLSCNQTAVRVSGQSDWSTELQKQISETAAAAAAKKSSKTLPPLLLLSSMQDQWRHSAQFWDRCCSRDFTRVVETSAELCYKHPHKH